MTRKQIIIKHVVTALFAVMCAAMVIWLRSGDESATGFMSYEMFGIVFSTTDFFVIVGSGICGYQYGIFIFLSALAAQAVQNGGAITGLFSLLIYFVIAVISGYFSERRWYKSWWRTLLAAFDFIAALGGLWYILFIQINNAPTFYSDMSAWAIFISAIPEVVAAVAVLVLFFNLVPDKVKKYIGKGYLYTKEYEQSEELLEGAHSVLMRQVTFMTMSEALLLSLFAVVFSNSQLNQLSQAQRSMIYQQRTIALSEDQVSEIAGTDDSESETASGESSGQEVSQTEYVPTDRPDYVPSDNGRRGRNFELNENQLEEISNSLMPDERSLFLMNIQLGVIVLSVALPLGMFFNSLIVRRVVLPIKSLSSVMTGYFSEDEEKRKTMIDKLKNLKIKGHKNEIGQLHQSMQRMIDDMTNYINAVEREKELEAELHVAEARSEAKSEFLSNMSHEIRTPINAILGMNEMILRESRESSTIEYAENVRNAGNTLLGLVNDILDFSKIEAGKMDIIPVDYDLASVLNDLVTMIQTRADNKGLVLNVKVDPDIPVHLHGDEIRIKQVVTNILTNAVKYTEKGSVSISVGYEVLPPENDKPVIGLRFTVSDTGIGIKEEDMSKLFSAFERIEEERNRTIEGTGLGMNITQRLLAMMDSKLEVSSVYGEGSTFSFSVKQGVVSEHKIGNYEESYRQTLADRRRYKEKFTAPEAEVLVVDDTKMNLAVFKSLLKKTLVKIDTASSGDGCIRLTQLKKYDIIFLDHRMPEKDGIETLHELHADADNPNISTPAVCLTANAISGAREMYIEAGFTDYLTKPIDPDHLEAALIKYLPAEKVKAASEDNDEPQEPETLPTEDNFVIPDWVRNIKDLDTSEGVRHCGDPEIYMETLTVYAESAAEGADEIERFWGERNIPDVTVKVHALKSTSRVIGAMKLGDFAEKMEKAGNDGDNVTLEDNMEQLIAQYRELGEALSPLVKNDEDESLPVMPAEKLYEAYDAIRELAEMFDYDSVLFVMDSLSGYRAPEEEKEKLAALKAAVSKPDWDMIKKVLEN